jgi:hypothetical protein
MLILDFNKQPARGKWTPEFLDGRRSLVCLFLNHTVLPRPCRCTFINSPTLTLLTLIESMKTHAWCELPSCFHSLRSSTASPATSISWTKDIAIDEWATRPGLIAADLIGIILGSCFESLSRGRRYHPCTRANRSVPVYWTLTKNRLIARRYDSHSAECAYIRNFPLFER